MSLEELFHSLPPEQRIFQFGAETDSPLTDAFPRKRVVHAGLHGTVVPPDESQQVWQRIMASAPAKKDIQTAYIHIPFCKTKCLYCGFFQNGTNQDVEDHYVDCLIQELEASADLPRLKDSLIHAVFIGGGTPTSLSPKNAGRLLQAICRCLPLANDYELTLEGRVHDLVPEKMDVWLANGVNRMSLGVQSFHTDIRRSVGRLDDEETVLKNLRSLLDYNQCAVVVDLIYGLPHQTQERWMENLAAAVALNPEHLSCYGLKVEEGTPLFAIKDTAGLPGDEEQADMYLQTVEFLKQYGYEQYEISNFAKPGRESRHNLKYWKLQEYAGFGPGAHSDFGGVRYAYEKDLDAYIAAAHGGQFRFSENTVIPPRDRDVEWVMLGARLISGLDPKDYEAQFRRRFDPIFLPFLQKCVAAGYAVSENGVWHLTPKGFLVSNQIIGGLLDAQAAEKQRRADAAARGDFRVNLD